MKTAIVDTTVLTDALLKSGEQARQAKSAIAAFEYTELPVYAIKEFKAGPLAAFVWLHNKFVSTRSFKAALEAVQHISRSPRRYFTSTALEALAEAQNEMNKRTLRDLMKKYGDSAKPDTFQADEYRLSLKSRILRAWSKRRSLTSETSYPLPCYPETEIKISGNGRIEQGRLACEHNANCALARYIRDKKLQSEKVFSALESLSETREQKGNKKVLKLALKGRFLDNVACRSIGDAAFSIMCPDGGTILTTNVSDHRPLAESIGKKALTPQEVLNQTESNQSESV